MPCIDVDALASEQKMDRGPVAVVVERPPLLHRNMLVILHVGDQLGAFRRHHLAKLRADCICRGFQALDPWEQSARVKFTLGQLGKAKVSWIAVVRLGSPNSVATKAIDPPALFAVGSVRGRSHCSLHPSVLSVLPRGIMLLGFGDHLAELLRYSGGRLLGQRMTPRLPSLGIT